MIEITDKIAEAYMDQTAPEWRMARPYVQGKIKSAVRADLERAAALLAPLLVADEREECARVAERRTSEGVASVALSLAGTDYMRGMTDTSEAVARAIRARGASCA